MAKRRRTVGLKRHAVNAEQKACDSDDYIQDCEAAGEEVEGAFLTLSGGCRSRKRSRGDMLCCMSKHSVLIIALRRGLPVLCLAHALMAQTPPAPAAPVSTAVANPHYVSIHMEVPVNKPAAEVWKRVGNYCDIGEWMQVSCTILSGKDNEFGAVRSVANEVLVGKTELSYTYTQPVREGRPYNLYHGTLEARPVTATTSKLIYTLMFDNSMLADEETRQKDIESRTTRFTGLLQNMKTLAEGGKLPPPAARGGQKK